MTHPNQEDWMSFLYGEDSPKRHQELDLHLKSCATCSARMNSWRTGARALDAWALSPVTRASGTAWRWAAAAALILGFGIALGRFSSPPAPEASALRATLQQEFEQKIAATKAELLAEMRQLHEQTVSGPQSLAQEKAGAEMQRWLTGFAREQEAQRQGDKETLVTLLREFDAKYATSLALLRSELETVAVNTQDGFTETEQRLGQLASSRLPTDLPSK